MTDCNCKAFELRIIQTLQEQARAAAAEIVRQMNADDGNIHQMEIEAIILSHMREERR